MADRDDPEHDRFKALCDQHYPAVLRYAARRVGAEVARDIAAVPFMTAWRRPDRMPAEAALAVRDRALPGFPESGTDWGDVIW